MDVQLHDLIFEPYIDEESIQSRVLEMASAIKEDLGEEKPVFLCMLNGAFVFMADLVRAFDGDCEIEFVKYHSYEGLESTGDLTEVMGVPDRLEDKHIIFVEDIIDSGNTLDKFLPLLYTKNPKSVRIVSLLLKPDALEHEVNVEHIGFEIGNAFVVGYGLDYDGIGRNLKSIYRLKRKASANEKNPPE